mmetsp:Transcript_22218/g.59244  ORF Transcript_22218/g.59244 Transcript_22218/m.59244 type:complete len:120 (+) Transcript_22218:2-361(+)
MFLGLKQFGLSATRFQRNNAQRSSTSSRTMARALAVLVFLALPCAAFNYGNWKHMLAPETLAAELPSQQVELDAGLDSVVMMQTEATPFTEPSGFAHVAPADRSDGEAVATAPLAKEDL